MGDSMQHSNIMPGARIRGLTTVFCGWCRCHGRVQEGQALQALKQDADKQGCESDQRLCILDVGLFEYRLCIVAKDVVQA
jgi:hypothetical protein